MANGFQSRADSFIPQQEAAAAAAAQVSFRGEGKKNERVRGQPAGSAHSENKADVLAARRPKPTK